MELQCNDVLSGTRESEAEASEWTGTIKVVCLDSTPTVLQDSCKAVSWGIRLYTSLTN